MSGLPDMLRRLPFVFYGLAPLFFIWAVINSWLTISAMGQYGDPSMEGVFAYQKSEALFRAGLEAVHLVGVGAMLHVLIAIYDKLKGAAE